MTRDDFHEKADEVIRGAVADRCAAAGAAEMDPGDLSASLLTILVACAFDVAEATPVPAEKALDLVFEIATRHAAICAAQDGLVGNA